MRKIMYYVVYGVWEIMEGTSAMRRKMLLFDPCSPILVSTVGKAAIFSYEREATAN